MHGLYGAALKNRVAELLVVVGLEKSADRRVATYSGGMKRRANLAAGIIHQPRLLVLDEPTVGLDPQSRGLIFDNLRALSGAGKTMSVRYALHGGGSEALHARRHHGLGPGAPQGPRRAARRQRRVQNHEELFLELTGRSLRDYMRKLRRRLEGMLLLRDPRRGRDPLRDAHAMVLITTLVQEDALRRPEAGDDDGARRGGETTASAPQSAGLAALGRFRVVSGCAAARSPRRRSAES
jgi:hypothetical protein